MLCATLNWGSRSVIILYLVQNIALLMALVVVLRVFPRGRRGEQYWSHPVVPLVFTGLLFGGFCLVGMMTPLRFAPGIIFDGRSIILAVAGMFGGPVVAVVSAAMCGAYRLWLGGAGAPMGLGVICESAALGVVWHYWRKRSPHLMNYFALWGFGLLVHVLMVASMLLLPADTRWDVISFIGPPVLLVYPLATMVVCRLFYDQEVHEKAQAALQESEEKYRELVEWANSIMLRWKPDGSISFINDYGARFFGYGREELIGQPVVGTIVPPTDTSGRDLAEMIRDITAHPERYLSNQNENVRKNGSRVWVSWTNRPIFDEEGRFVEMFAVGNDITDRKRAEDALRETNALHTQFMRHSPIYAYIKSVTPTESRVLQASENFQDMVGLRGQDMVGKTMDELFPPEFAKKITADDWAVVLRGKLLRHEEELNGRSYTTMKFPIVLGNRTLVAGYTIDVTDRKRAEDGLRRAHERLRQFVDANILGVIIATPEGGILEANDYYIRLLGYTREEFFSTKVDWRSLTPPEWLPADEKAIRELREYGRCAPYEKEYLRRDGTRVPVLLVDTMLPGPEEQIAAFVLDLSERKRVEEEYRTLFRQMLDGFAVHEIICDEAGHPVDYRYLKVNPAFERMTGLKAEDVLGRTVLEVLPATEKYWIETYGNVALTGEPVLFENYAEELDKHFRVTAFQPAPGQFACIFADVTARKKAEIALRESEARFRSYFDLPLHGIAITSPGKGWIQVNERVCSMLGYSREELLHMTWAEVTHPDDLAADAEQFERILAGETDQYRMEKRFIRKDGTAIWIDLAAGCVRKSDGSVDYFVALLEDISDRKEAEAEKDRLEAQLQQSQKMESVGRLAGGVAHDFNNMLGVILGFADMALMRVNPADPIHEDLEEIRKAAERSADLTSQLLAFARRQTVAPRLLDLNETVGGSLKMLQRLIGENVSLAWAPGPSLWPVRMDPSQISQILANLCVNAKDAITDTGTLRIETENCRITPGHRSDRVEIPCGEYVLLSVGDDGCGMDQETLDRIFEPFFTTKEFGRGTGLGLATIYGIVRQNNGFIDVQSVVGKGTRFLIYLPRYAGADESSAVNGSPDSARRRGDETILLVEDEGAFLKLTKTILEEQGYTVLAAGTPGEAIRLAREHAGEIHLLLTDVVMPEMNGRDLAKNILSLYPSLKRLYMSGYTSDVIADHGVLDSGTHFIHKPFNAPLLTAKVREALDSD